ncbi:MAG: L-2-amino-thiazoline-4-carboxylic acid hydrolase [Lachnospiraceae bacterium]|nr:L-2-amino-thiazoline-4-carboxylic acid hydrolase [Lachnospiraceae bacterium]
MSEFTKTEEIQIGNLQDCWSIIYECMAKAVVEMTGVEGECALRQGIRNYGIERGIKMQERHRKLGIKLNLENLFTYFDLPGDPRFKREKLSLTPQERLSYTLVCPIAHKWIEDGNKTLGRIYCEEFHHACFGAYAPHTQTNLAKTLTEDGDNYCCFSVYLRPGNMTAKERRAAFEEFDPDYCPPKDFCYDLGTHKAGFNRLSILIIYFIADAVTGELGERGEKAVIEGMKNIRKELAAFMAKRAGAVGTVCSEDFLEKNRTLHTRFSNDSLWNEYPNEKVKALAKKYIYEE